MYSVNKKVMREACARFGIEVTENASKGELLMALKTWFENLAAFATGKLDWDGKPAYEMKPTTEATREYHVEYMMRGYITVRADGEDVAEKYAVDELDKCFNPYLTYYTIDTDNHEIEILDVELKEDAEG